MTFLRASRLSACVAVLAAGACAIPEGDASGRACVDDAECPTAYECVAGPAGQGLCEVIFPPRSPSYFNPKPTAEERELLGRWLAAGAPYCDTDGGN